MHKNIVIVQRKIPHYRLEFFAAVFKRIPGACLYHSDKSMVSLIDKCFKAESNHRLVPILNIGPVYFQQIFKLILKKKIDTIVLGLELRNLSGLLVWLLSLIFRRKIIWWTHGFNVHLNKKNYRFKLDRTIKVILLKKAYRVLLYTRYNIDELINHGVDPSKIVVLNNTLNETPFQNAISKIDDKDLARLNSAVKPSSHTIAFIGSLTKRKRVELLIDLATELLQHFSDLRVFVIGDGEDRARLERLVHQKRLESCVFFLGQIINPASLSPYMILSDFVVNPGAVGLSVMHAMIYGVPFLTLKNENHGPEIDYIENEYNGYIGESIADLCNWIMVIY